MGGKGLLVYFMSEKCKVKDINQIIYKYKINFCIQLDGKNLVLINGYRISEMMFLAVLITMSLG